jgi:drug/metabolite transporter (DMT)-like permease
MSPDTVPARAILLTAVAMFCFAANSILCRLALAPGLIDAATFTTVRVFSGGAMLSAVAYVLRGQLPRLAQVSLPSAIALLGYLIFFSFAYARLDAGSGALILIGAVQIIMFGKAFVEGERFLLSQWAGLGLALFGFAYLVSPGISAPDALGAVLMALSGISWGCFSLLARGGRDPIAANAGNFLVCLVPTMIVNLLFGHPLGAAPAGLLLAAISGAIATGFGYVVWYFAVRDLPVTHAATAQLSMPALVAFGGATFLSEPITTRLLMACAAMLGGIALVVGRQRELLTDGYLRRRRFLPSEARSPKQKGS